MRTNQNLFTAAIGLLGLLATVLGATEFGSIAIESVSADVAGLGGTGSGETEEMHW